MKETFESELYIWQKEYKKKEKELLKKNPLDNTLSNQHPINKLQKEFWQKKIEIYKKYNKLDSTQK